jgi:transketolase
LIRLAAACAEQLCTLAGHDHRIWFLDGDLADSYGGTAFEQRWPERFIMAGIAEQNMVSMAAGMAACGARPWAFSFAAFLAYRAADQIRVCLSQAGAPVVLVGSHAGGCGGKNGKTHQAVGDLAVLGALANLAIWTPADSDDVAYAVRAILASGEPSYLRMPREEVGPLPGTPGPLRLLTPQAPVIVLTSGLSAHWAMEALQYLRESGLQLAVLHVGRFAPLPEGLGARLAAARRWYVVEDHVRHGGLGDAAARLVDRQPDRWFGWPADWPGGSGSADELRRSCGLDGPALARAFLDDWRGSCANVVS